jgi:hypothetical protein
MSTGIPANLVLQALSLTLHPLHRPRHAVVRVEYDVNPGH